VAVLALATPSSRPRGLRRTGQDLRIAVVDFGGGTLDVTIMEFGKGVFEVKAVTSSRSSRGI